MDLLHYLAKSKNKSLHRIESTYLELTFLICNSWKNTVKVFFFTDLKMEGEVLSMVIGKVLNNLHIL